VKFSAFDLYVLLAFGGIGLVMRLNGFPLAPMILALILGDLMEENMRRALQISGGDWTTFLTKPIAASLLAIAIVSLAAPPLVRLWRWQRNASGRASTGA
jgi:putative tricarboxylic transport membrane protein